MNISKQKIVPGRDTQDLTAMVNKLTSGKPFVVTNFTETRNLDNKVVALADVGNVLCTLIKDLIAKGIIQEK